MIAVARVLKTSSFKVLKALMIGQYLEYQKAHARLFETRLYMDRTKSV